MTEVRTEHLGPDELKAAMRAWAAGSLPDMAAVELLIAHEHWLRRQPFLQEVVLSEDREFAAPSWFALRALLDSGEGLFDTSSERGVLAVACSLGGRHPVELGDVLLSCDQTNVRLIADAVLMAGGAR
ncbi:hypothetical protein ACU61A_15900 [Pseudonocardia sichuanensis]